MINTDKFLADFKDSYDKDMESRPIIKYRVFFKLKPGDPETEVKTLFDDLKSAERYADAIILSSPFETEAWAEEAESND